MSTLAAETDRQVLLRRLISAPEDATQTMSQLAALGWDCDAPAVILTRTPILRLLNGYLKGTLSSTGVEYWANCIEGRDDIAFDAAHQAQIDSLIYELANPALTQPLTSHRAKKLLAGLSQQS